MLTFNAHTTNVANKINNRNKVLKSLAGSDWGNEKEVLLTTCKSIGRSVPNYAAPIWTPQTSDSNWKKIQTAQKQSSQNNNWLSPDVQ